MTDMNLEQFLAAELANLESFKAFYLRAVAKFPEHFGLCQTQELWQEELRAFVECRSFHTTCLQCEPESCNVVSNRLSDSDT